MSYVIVSGISLVVGALIYLGCLLWSIDRSVQEKNLSGDEFTDIVKTRPKENK